MNLQISKRKLDAAGLEARDTQEGESLEGGVKRKKDILFVYFRFFLGPNIC